MAKVINLNEWKKRKAMDEAELEKYEERQAAIRRLLGYAELVKWGNDDDDS
jgi:hypothetical protein